jgi:glycosyltransferase involved in cell wall biosynthesis
MDILSIAYAIKPHHPEVVFLIIGEEANDAIGYKAEMENIVKQLGLEQNVIFMGYKDIIGYENFDAFIHLVGDEAYPVTILEALQKNVPVITSYQKGTGEIYHPMLFHCTGPQEAAAKIHYLMQLRPKHMKRVAQEFSEVYKNVMA